MKATTEAVREAPRKPAAKVIPLARRDPAPDKRRRGILSWAKKHWIKASCLLAVVLPTAIATLYIGLIASDRYSVEVKLAVRGQDTPAVDALGILGSFGGGNMTTDAYIMIDYVLGRNMVDELSKNIDLRKIYSKPSIDWFSRLNPDKSVEDTIDYWQKMATAVFEPSTGIIRIEVTAYSPKDAVSLSNAVIASADALINRLSAESRRDALKAATVEVERAEQRQRMLRAAMRKFREEEQIADPVRRAGFQQEMIEKSKAELQRIDTELQTARGFMKDTAPSIMVLKNQRAAAVKQLDSLQREISGDTLGTGQAKGQDSIKAVASMLSTFEELEAERGFAEKAYLTALASLERARYEADRKQRYLAIFEKAELPQDAKYPKRISDIFMIGVAAALLWGLGVFIIMGIREHA
jgi:capsular polysaccharide transport system permease protein